MEGSDRLLGAELVDTEGRVLGSVSALLVDPDGRGARWLDVLLSSGRHAVLPVDAASSDAAGVLTVPYSLADLATAPRTDGPLLSVETAGALLDHYGFPPDGT